jgi:hypothetical protein
VILALELPECLPSFASISRNYLHPLLELMKSMGKSWQCIDLQVKYGKVCTLWYDAAGSSGIMGLTFSSSAHVTKVRCVFISLKS